LHNKLTMELFYYIVTWQVALQSWLLVFTKRDQSKALDFLHSLKRITNSMGIKVHKWDIPFKSVWCYHFSVNLSLSTIVLNNRGWLEKMTFEIYAPPKSVLYPIKLTKVYWYSYNNTIPLSNAQIFCPVHIILKISKLSTILSACHNTQ